MLNKNKPRTEKVNKHLNIINNLIKPIFVYSLVFVFLFNTSVINASIVIDKKYGNAYKENASNGVPIININKPNAHGGISHNIYEELNVGKEGVIFNNSNRAVNTHIGGLIAANNNFTDGEAGLILNEVSGKSASNLLGYMEVSGSRADLIIANQNGIVCNGCSFLNVNRGVLTTGQAAIENNLLKGFSVNKGTVAIGYLGLNDNPTFGTDSLDIIAKRLDLKEAINGKEISIILGNQEYNYQNKTSNSLENEAKEVFAISSSQVGGIYGDYIRLISLNEGVGVNIDFRMGTNVSNIEVDVNGDLKIRNTAIEGKDANKINAQNIEIGDSVITGISTTLNAKNNIEITQRYATIDGTLTTNSQNFKVNKDSSLHATINSTNHNSFTLNSKTLENEGLLFSETDFNVNVDNLYNKEGATIFAGDNLTFRGYANNNGYANNKMQSLINSSGRIEANGNIDIKTHILENKVSWVNAGQVTGEYYDIKGERIGANNASQNLFLHLSDPAKYPLLLPGINDQYYLDRYSDSKLVKGERDGHHLEYFDVGIKARDTNYVIHSQAGAANLSSGGNLTIEADNIDNYGSKITAIKDIKITVNTITNRSVSGQSFSELVTTREFWRWSGPDVVYHGSETHPTTSNYKDIFGHLSVIGSANGGTVSIKGKLTGNGEVKE